MLYLQIHLLTKICNPKISTCGTFLITCGHMQSCEKFESSDMNVPSEVKQGSALPSCFSSYTINKCPLHGLFSATFSHFYAFFGDFTA